MLLKLSKIFLYASLLSVVLVSTSTFFPFIGVKYYFFRVTVEASLALLLFSWAFEMRDGEMAARIKASLRPLLIAVGIFTIVFLLASIFAYDPHAAFWSNYERGEGGFQMLHYFGFFALLVLLMRDEKDWRRLFGVSLIACGLMVLYGVLGAAGVSGFVPASSAPGMSFFAKLFSPASRFQGSLGNAEYVAPYLIFSIFYALYLWFTKARTAVRSVSYGVIILFLLVFFVASQTRGAFLGLVAGAFAAIVYAIFRNPRWRVKGAIVLAVLVAIGGTLFLYRANPTIARLPGARFLQIDFHERTFQTRIWTWQSAWEGFKERPLLGWGPENFSTVFDRHFNPNHFVPGQASETWFDRAHSVIFGYLADTGILGLLAYLGIFAVFYWEFFRRARPGDGGLGGIFINALILAIPIAYLVQGLALFDVLPIFINFLLFLGFAHYRLYSSKTVPA